MNRQLPVDLQTLVDSHDLPYQVIDSDRRIVAVNSAFLRRFACHADEVVGAHCFRVTHGRERACHLDGDDCPHEHVFRFRSRINTVREKRDVEGGDGVLHQIGVPLTTADGDLLMGKSLVHDAAPEQTEPLARIEQRQIRRLLEICDGNRRRVAERLGISERTLYRRLKHYRSA